MHTTVYILCKISFYVFAIHHYLDSFILFHLYSISVYFLCDPFTDNCIVPLHCMITINFHYVCSYAHQIKEV